MELDIVVIKRHRGQVQTLFLKIWELPQNFRCHKGDMKQVTYWGPTNIRHHHTRFSNRPTSHRGFVYPWLKP